MAIMTAGNRPAIPAPKNPLDKCTIVSIYSKEIRSIKPTIQPGYFLVKAGSYENPSILVVGSSSWWKDVDIHQPLLEIPNSSIQVADSIIKDYCNGLLGANGDTTGPGLFFVVGEHTIVDVKTKYKGELAKAKIKQDNWYRELVKMADTGWARTNGNPLTISDDMRDAAMNLGLKEKAWMKDAQSMELIPCVACGARRNPLFPICQSCKAIVDPVKAKELGLVFAS